MAQEIPDDVALSILSKLPLKSLKRFLCVRKPWHLLFENENPYFMTMFRTNFISKTHSDYQHTSILLLQSHPTQNMVNYLYLISDQRPVKLDWPPPFQAEPGYSPTVLILGSGIHGTLCLYDYLPLSPFQKIVLWNPATHQFSNLPPSTARPLPHMGIYIQLHGFGYDHVTDDYKLIQHARFFDSDAEDDYRPYNYRRCQDPIWEIYSLRSNSWRKLDHIDNELGDSKLEEVGYRIYTNGVSHWLVELHGRTDEPFLASFNFSNEIAFKTMLPLHLRNQHNGYNYLAVLNGSIAVISAYGTTTSFQISILGELGVEESWTKLFIVGPLPCLVHPVGAGKKGDIFFLKEDGELVCFDLSTMMIEEIGVKCFFIDGGEAGPKGLELNILVGEGHLLDAIIIHGTGGRQIRFGV